MMAAEDAFENELPLPKGWIKSHSKKFKKPYYYHENTKCSIWVHPALLQEDGGKSLVKNALTKGNNEGSASYSKADRLPARRVNSASSALEFLGLGHRNTVHKNHGSIGQYPMMGGRKVRSLSPVSLNSSVSTMNRVRERSPIEFSNQDCETRFGQRRISSSSITPEKQFNDTKTLHNLESQKLLGKEDSSDKSVGSVDDRNAMKPKLKPLAPTHKTDFQQNRKRRSSESDISHKAEIQSKLLKISNEDDDHTKPKRIDNKPLTPAMKAIIAKREGKSTMNTKELLKSDRNKRVIGKSKINAKVSVPTPAMVALSKKRNMGRFESVVEKNIDVTKDESDEETSITIARKRVKKKTKTKVIKTTAAKTDIISSIMSKCSNFITALRPLKPIATKPQPDIPCGEAKTLHESTSPKRVHASNSLAQDDHVGLDINLNKCNDFISSPKPLKPIAAKPDEFKKQAEIPVKVTESSCSFIQNKQHAKLDDVEENSHSFIQNKRHAKLDSVEESSYSFIQNKRAKLDDVEDMEVDDPVTVKITKDIRELREDNVFQKPTANEGVQKQELPVYSDPLYIVLDTNVLLSNLEFISELKDYPIPVIGAPILMIPWMVFQELDSLKDAVKRFHMKVNEAGVEETAGTLSALSRKAINFIGSCLDGHHPRVKGQSAIEAGTPIKGFTEENNDDSIIHCALCLKLQSVRSNVVLLSNDRNLCNKSIIFGVKAFSQKGIIPGLNKLFGTQKSEVKTNKAVVCGGNDDSQEVQKNSTENKVDEISCELQCVLRDSFSKIIETEMISAYGDNLWLEIVKIKPPWTLGDIFILFEKHWIAVFGLILGRRHDKTISDLKDMYLSAKTTIISLDAMKSMLQLSVTVLKGCLANSSYSGKVKESIQLIDALLKRCNNLNQEPTETKTKINQKVDNSKSPNINNCEKQQTSYEKVRLMFDDIWNTATHFSALIFSSLNFPSPLVKNLDPEQQIPGSDESFHCLSVLTPCLFSLVQSIHNVISTLDSETSGELSMKRLYQSICTFFNEVMKRECTLYLDDVAEFCQDKNAKEIFIQGLSQLDRLYAMLQQCGEFSKDAH